MSYITPVRRDCRLPVLCYARLATGGNSDVPTRAHVYQNKVALAANTQTCILTGAIPGLQEFSL